jgi:hypothetical protein
MGAKQFFVCVMLLLLGAFLCAQTINVEQPLSAVDAQTEDADYQFTDGTFLQTLNWVGQDTALYYIVQIQKVEKNEWVEHLEEQSDIASIQVSLSDGQYRYRVIAYDFLRRAGPESTWVEFEVFYAWQPEIYSFFPTGFYLDEDLQWELTVSGENFVEGGQIYMRSAARSIKPISVTINARRNSARLVFAERDIDTGKFELYSINPGGLEATLGTFTIAFKKVVDVNVSFGYMPLVPLYGEVNTLWEQKFFPLGFYARMGVFFLKHRWGYMGVELEPYWNHIQIKMDYYTESAHLAGAALYWAYQKWLPNRTMSLNARIGFGFYSLFDYHIKFSNVETDPLTVLIPSVNAGASFQWLFKIPWFVEAGINYTHFFIVDKPQPGYLVPFIGAGIQL